MPEDKSMPTADRPGAGLPGKDENAQGWIKSADLPPTKEETPTASDLEESVAGEEDPGASLDSPG